MSLALNGDMFVHILSFCITIQTNWALDEADFETLWATNLQTRLSVRGMIYTSA